jgi:hypothetical protein
VAVASFPFLFFDTDIARGFFNDISTDLAMIWRLRYDCNNICRWYLAGWGAISTCDCQIWEPFPPVTVVLGAISICDCCFGSHFHLWLSDLGSHFHLWLSDLGAISTCDCQIWEPFPLVTVRFGSHFHLWLSDLGAISTCDCCFGSHFNLWLSDLGGAISTCGLSDLGFFPSCGCRFWELFPLLTVRQAGVTETMRGHHVQKWTAPENLI